MNLLKFKRRAEAMKVDGERFHALDLRSMKTFGSTWSDCSFVDCQLDLSDMRTNKFERVLFQNCSARAINFSTSFFEDCLFLDCDLEQTSFMGSHFRDGGFKECRMAYGETMFQDVTMKGRVRFVDCNLHGSSLDFREIEPRGLSFEGCNLWSAKIALGCAFWNASFDERSIRQFLALVGRVSEDPRIAQLAGDQFAVVNRAMDGVTKCQDSTTSPATTSTPIPNFQDQTAGTASVMITPTRTTRTN